MVRDATEDRAATGVSGLDDILLGSGLPRNRLYLLQGSPGVGKTTLGLQFLLEGARRGEAVLYITLSETAEEIFQVAASHGWSLDGVSLYELSTAEQTLRLEEENTLYATSEIELKETVRVLLQEVERIAPSRVVFDSLSEIRLLAQTPVRYRRQLLALKQHFAGKSCTVLLLDNSETADSDHQVASLAHGVITLEQMPVSYGGDRRRLRVAKLRGSDFRSGYHDFAVRTGGIVVYPRLIAAEHRTRFAAEPLPSGVAGLDQLLGGGLDRGTSSLIMGPAGTGKSAIATLFAREAALRGELASFFVFEERVTTLLRSSAKLSMPLEPLVESGKIRMHQVDPAELAPDELSHLVRRDAEQGARVIVIDSINGYFAALPEASFVILQLHELLSFLSSQGVATLLTVAQTGIIAGGAMRAPIDLSYLADNVVLLRYFEAAGRVRKAISVVKKRTGAHEDTIREFSIGSQGITVGDALTQFHGVLTGVPRFVGTSDTLLTEVTRRDKA